MQVPGGKLGWIFGNSVAFETLKGPTGHETRSGCQVGRAPPRAYTEWLPVAVVGGGAFWEVKLGCHVTHGETTLWERCLGTFG